MFTFCLPVILHQSRLYLKYNCTITLSFKLRIRLVRILNYFQNTTIYFRRISMFSSNFGLVMYHTRNGVFLQKISS